MQKIALSLLGLFILTTLAKQQFFDEEVVCQELENSCYDDYEPVYPDTDSQHYQYYYETPNLYFEYETQEEKANPSDYTEV